MQNSNLILQIPPSDPRWTSFLDVNTDINIFYHPAWMTLMAECYGYRPFVLALSDEEGGFSAGIPMMEVNSPINGRRWVSLPFSDYCFPLSKNESILKIFTEQILCSAAEAGVSVLELRGAYPHQSLNMQSNHVIHKLDLMSDTNQTWAAMHSMHRRNVKTAMKNGVEIIQGETQEHMAEFYRLHLQTRRKQGVPIQPLKFFLEMKKLLLDKGYGFLLLAYYDHRCIAGAIFLHWKDTFTYKYGASREDSLNYRPNNLIFWTAIQRACELGFKYFDMGRTDLDNSGLRLFKSRWGAKEIPLVYSNLGMNPRGSVEGGLARYMHFVIQNSPTWVCRITGELLYRHFG